MCVCVCGNIGFVSCGGKFFTWCYFIVSLGLDGRDAKDQNNFQLWAKDVLVTLQIIVG